MIAKKASQNNEDTKIYIINNNFYRSSIHSGITQKIKGRY